MSAVRSEPAVTSAATDMSTTATFVTEPARLRRVTTRHAFPVGAHFPRRTAAERLALSATVTSTAVHAPVFPIGARFPRRSASDAVLYLAGLAAAGERTLGFDAPIYPVGARFPRQAYSHLGPALAG